MNLNKGERQDIETGKHRYTSKSELPDTLADIYKDDINMSIWQRTLSPELLKASDYILKGQHPVQFSASLAADDTFDILYSALGAGAEAELICTDVSNIVNMFCYLFELKAVGLRLSALDRAMCPKFHVDRVPCRLITTYSSIATEWLAHEDVNRSKLGMGCEGKTDDKSGLYKDPSCIQQLKCGDVALLKGESWLGNEGGGLVHRSPNLIESQKRLLLTLDFN